jgi:hypothetical protein
LAAGGQRVFDLASREGKKGRGDGRPFGKRPGWEEVTQNLG